MPRWTPGWTRKPPRNPFESRTEVQERIMNALTVPTRYPPDITLEELDRDEIVVRISATPERPSDGSRLASEVLAAIRDARANGAGATTARTERDDGASIAAAEGGDG